MTGGEVKKSFFWFKESPSLGIYDKLSSETNVCSKGLLSHFLIFVRRRQRESLRVATDGRACRDEFAEAVWIPERGTWGYFLAVCSDS